MEYKYWFVPGRFATEPSYRIVTSVPIQKGDVMMSRKEGFSLKVVGIAHLFLKNGQPDESTRLLVEEAADSDFPDDSVALP